MSETITLPRSGVVLTWDTDFKRYTATLGDSVVVTYLPGALMCEGLVGNFGRQFTHEADCVADMDVRVLALRAALLPADARERVRRVLDVPALADVDTGDMADAVLAALGIGGAK